MNHSETVRLACLAVGIDASTSMLAAQAHHRMVSGLQAVDHVDAAAAKIAEAFDFTAPPAKRMTVKEICEAVGIASTTRADMTRVGQALMRITRRSAIMVRGKRLYIMPPLRR